MKSVCKLGALVFFLTFLSLGNLSAHKIEAPRLIDRKSQTNYMLCAGQAIANVHSTTGTNSKVGVADGLTVNNTNRGDQPENLHLADKPLFRDPVFDGAADPVLVWNSAEQRWFMFYTNRRATVQGTGVEWVHGTHIGIAESTNGGASWSHRGVANINYGGKDVTFWAPDVLENNGMYHMFLTIVPGIFTDWRHPRTIVHLTSKNLIDWNYQSTLPLASDKVIDADVVKGPNGKWHLYYNYERDRKSIHYAVSEDLFNWVDRGRVIGDRPGEGPVVFLWKGKYFMLVDNWEGLGVYSSENLENWVRQERNILQEGGKGLDDFTKGQHGDVIVHNNRAFVFYFTHPGRIYGQTIDNYNTRRTSIQVAELEFINGEITVDRNKPVFINLSK